MSNIPVEVLISIIDLHSITAHNMNTPLSTAWATMPKKIQHPVISAARTSEEWAYFVQRQLDYKSATHLDENDVFQLLECCNEILRKDLTKTFNALASTDKQTVLHNIKSLAVCQENIMIALVWLQHMYHVRNETIRAFSAHLQSRMPFSLVPHFNWLQ